MQLDNKFLADLSKLASGAVGAAADMRREAMDQLTAQFEKVLLRMDLVRREEFEVARAMVAKARDEQAELLERIRVLEAKAGIATATEKPAPKVKKEPAASTKKRAPGAPKK